MKTKCKERPILFSGPMVLAILDGKKTQTRRIVKPQPHDWAVLSDGIIDRYKGVIKCPYGEIGSRLWVREEHYRFGHWEPVPGVKTKTGRMKWRFVADSEVIRFDEPDSYRKGRHHKDPATSAWHKRLARFMPRWASRINLEIIGIRVERLQDISEADAKAEGVEPASFPEDCTDDDDFLREECGYFPPRSYAGGFMHLWDDINGKREGGRKTHNKEHAKRRENYSWESNPYVWVVEFKRVEETV